MKDIYVLTGIAIFQVLWFLTVFLLMLNQRKFMRRRDKYYEAQFNNNSNQAVIDFLNETKTVLNDIKKSLLK